MFDFIKSFKAFGVIEKLRDAYIHENSISLADAQTKIINAGRSLNLNDRRHVTRSIIDLNLEALSPSKDSLPPAAAIAAITESATELGFNGELLLRCVLVPYVEQNQRFIKASSDGDHKIRVLQSLFNAATGGKRFENSQVIVSEQLGPNPDSVAVVFKNVAGPLVLADHRALPAPKMFVHIDSTYRSPQNIYRNPYLSFVADAMALRQP